jgi:exonuclease III
MPLKKQHIKNKKNSTTKKTTTQSTIPQLWGKQERPITINKSMHPKPGQHRINTTSVQAREQASFPSYAANNKEKTHSLVPSSTIRSTSKKVRGAVPSQSKTEHDEKTTAPAQHSPLSLKNYTQIKLQPSISTNIPFGDNIHEETEGDKLLFHNINGIKDSTNWFQITTTMKELNMDIFGFAEINRSMAGGEFYKWTDIIKKQFFYSRTAFSKSNIKTDSKYKPGGTMTTITGRWQSRIAEQGQDPKGLGRWNFLRLASRKASLVIVTAYRPCVTNGPTTSWMQQWSMLREAGEHSPDPVKSFYKDLESALLEWKTKKYNIILMMDANEHVGEKPGGLTSVIGKAELTDLTLFCHPNSEPPNTHARGTKKIDYIFGSIQVKENCTRAGILPYGVGYESDHRALFVNIDIEKILQSKLNSIDSVTARKLQQATPKERQIFLETAHYHFENQNVYGNRQASLTY